MRCDSTFFILVGDQEREAEGQVGGGGEASSLPQNGSLKIIPNDDFFDFISKVGSDIIHITHNSPADSAN